MKCRLTCALLVCLFLAVILPAQPTSSAVPGPVPRGKHTLTAGHGQLLLDGKPFQIISGELHYPRIPREYWRDRFRKAKAMGLNTITTYVFWNVHETSPGHYDFKDNADVAEFVREAQQEGLFVILRPGPYVCAEWEFGGFPAWLLKNPGMVVRGDNPEFMAAVSRWFARLGQELTPLLATRGGPILAVQVENEYGSFGDDHQYVKKIQQAVISSGMGDALLYTADNPENLAKGSLPELAAIVTLGPGHVQNGTAALKAFRPDGPCMVGEYWAGWFDTWGVRHQVTDGALQATELASMLKQGCSVNLYMFHGGTNFGWMNGANSNGRNYQPDTASYDYDAPLDERGTPRLKYFEFRKVIAEAAKITPPEVPATAAAAELPLRQQPGYASLWDNLPSPAASETPIGMEALDQAFGYVLYRTTLPPSSGGDLVVDGLHDYAQIYLDQALTGTLDRRLDEDKIALPVSARSRQLDILVENSGRVNFSAVVRGERKGIRRAVLAGTELKSWSVYSLPFENLANLRFESKSCNAPCFYRATLDAGATTADTFLDTKPLGKGMVWINRRPLGRFWSIGPQTTLYVPAPWLKPGANELTVFDLSGTPKQPLQARPAAGWTQ